YKDEAVVLVVNTGRTVAVVPRELGINEAMLGRWVKLHKDRQGGGETPLSESEQVELLQRSAGRKPELSVATTCESLQRRLRASSGGALHPGKRTGAESDGHAQRFERLLRPCRNEG